MQMKLTILNNTQHSNTLPGLDHVPSPTQPQYQTILYCQGSTLEVEILPPELLLGLGFVKHGETEQRAVSTSLQPPLDSGITMVLLILFCNKSSKPKLVFVELHNLVYSVFFSIANINVEAV
ncbi:hypothetical protein ACB098_11G053000 [Castanea mollissima]